MIFAAKLAGYFLLWGLWAYGMHMLAHSHWRRYNFVRYFHLKHHQYEYGASMLPPWHDYLFWFGSWRSSMDVYQTFTIPLIALAFFDPPYGYTLLGFHYVYEVFLSRNVLDHNPSIHGRITRFIPIGEYHLRHHRNVRCNYSFYLTFWDHVFGTAEPVSAPEPKERPRMNDPGDGMNLEQNAGSAP
jgi:sterol desaturase/sphingolipid hydroxylase (fatty acid hydroxylase superfamily)